MKKVKNRVLLVIISLSLTLNADDDVMITGDFSVENIESPLLAAKPHKGGPFRLEISSDAIGQAKLSRHNYHRQRLAYDELNADGTLVFYYNPQPKEAAYCSLGYCLINLAWNHNPYFRQKEFNNLSFAIGSATKRFSCWVWRSQIVANMNLDHLNLNQYLTWDFLCWGKYKYRQVMNFHIGIYGWTGMRINRLVPIVGFDWSINEKWKLNLVFPVNLSLVYRFNPCWSVAMAARALTSRNRLGRHENLNRGLYEYRTVGSEFNLRYKNEDCFPVEANLHCGWSFGGTLKVSNKHHRHQKTFNVGMAPYVGGEVSARF